MASKDSTNQSEKASIPDTLIELSLGEGKQAGTPDDSSRRPSYVAIDSRVHGLPELGDLKPGQWKPRIPHL